MLQLDRQRRRQQELEWVTEGQLKEVEELRRKQEEKVQAAMRANKEKEEKVLRENKESMTLLLDENKAELAALLEKQEKDKAARKRKADGPAAPECPVCIFGNFEVLQLFLLQVCLTEMKPPTRIFQCLNGHHVCETCK